MIAEAVGVALASALTIETIVLIRVIRPNRGRWPEPATDTLLAPPPAPPSLFEYCVELLHSDLAAGEPWVVDGDTLRRRVDPGWIIEKVFPNAAMAELHLRERIRGGDPASWRIIGTVPGARTRPGVALFAGAPPEEQPMTDAAVSPLSEPDPAEPAGPQSLYDQLGGEVVLSAVIKGFYKRVLADERLAWLFAGVVLNELVRHQVLVFTILTGGPNPKGLTVDEIHAWVREKHAKLGVRDVDFDLIKEHLGAEITEAGAAQFLPPLAAAFESFRVDVVTVRPTAAVTE
jgi:hemoglobin